MGRRSQHVLTGVVVCLFLLSVGTVGFIAVNGTGDGEPFTEFYVLGPEGNASNYPTNLTLGETGRITVGIANHERKVMTYTLVLQLAEERIERTTVTIESGEAKERQFSFSPDSVGREELHLLLYKGQSPPSSTDPYRRLGLWINTSSPTYSDTSSELAVASIVD